MQSLHLSVCSFLKIAGLILDNTFFGTFLAGVLLAGVGLLLYRREKNIDIQFEDKRKVRENASLLFTHIDIASKKYKAIFNIHDPQYPDIKKLYDALNSKFPNYIDSELQKDFNDLSTKITSISDDLIAQLKFVGYSGLYIDTISENIPKFNMFLLLGSASRSHQSDLKKEFEILEEKLKTSLQKIIGIQKS